MTESTFDPMATPEPSAQLKELGRRMVGKARLSGGVEGTTEFGWMEGGFFLIQRVDLTQYGRHIKGIEIIGHLRPFGEPPSDEIRSRFYDNYGNTLDYVYELDGDTLTVWGGEKGSPAYMKATIEADGTSRGEWVYPGGGGYQFASTPIVD
ncbi:MAG TPA: hypothetical protein VFR23_04825 [Jiangellaceae bacterium]|nr:hypothetical protein [Jiangellaceae bacterium]